MSDITHKIKVMQAYEDGAEIETRQPNSGAWVTGEPTWAWDLFDYRIKPQPKDIYVNEYEDGGISAHTTAREARDYVRLFCPRGEIEKDREAVHYREVIE